MSVDYGTGNFRRFININNCYQHIGESNALALQFFHALSGCDSTSFIYKKSKTVLLNRWMYSPKYEDLTEAFQKLSWLPSQQTIEECLPILYQFLESAFGGGYGGNLDEFRLTTFKASSKHLVIIFASCCHLEEKERTIASCASGFISGWLGLGQCYIPRANTKTF